MTVDRSFQDFPPDQLSLGPETLPSRQEPEWLPEGITATATSFDSVHEGRMLSRVLQGRWHLGGGNHGKERWDRKGSGFPAD